MTKIAIFGAGAWGEIALEKIGKERVGYFLDNDFNRQYTKFHDIEIISLEDFLPLKNRYHVVVASLLYASEMEKQLKELGITDYSNVIKYKKYFDTDELIVNSYEYIHEAKTEAEFNANKNLKQARKGIYDAVEEIYGREILFNHIEVETINRCNGSCSFCPVNHRVDPREKKIMSEEMFKSIVDQLEELEYTGRFTTFSNNEPLLDERIVEFNQYAREHLPKAKMHLFTNGTLLTLDKFKMLVECLDELIIDNYNQNLELIKPCIQIVEYCESHPELKKKVTIDLRKPQEILTTRGGNAPNRSIIPSYAKDRCILPFQQIIVRPDGKVSLCCNDALGEYTLGDLSKESLTDIWYGSKFKMVRKCLYEGREKWGNCKLCDVFITGY